MKATELRQSILQRAVQGKLVQQHLHDEPASELLSRIRDKKAQLIDEGKIKKEKSLSPIEKDEIPYDLPRGWVWCRFSETGIIASNLVSPFEHLQSWHIAPANIEKHTGKLLECRTVKEDEVKSNNHLFSTGQIIYSKIRPALRKVVIAPFDGLCSADMYPIDALINSHYMVYYMLSLVFTQQVVANDTRVKMPKTNQEELRKVLIPVPPFAEQERIVDKIDKLMVLCDELEAAEKELDSLEENFIEYLPKSILQMAVQGKIVPQSLHDKPATELLDQIRKEKARLIKTGEIKREKQRLPITEDEIPYDLPGGWVWCRLGDLCITIMGQSPKGDTVSDSIDGLEFHQGKSCFTDVYISKSKKQTSSPRKVAKAGDVLLAVRAPVGAVNITPREICVGRGLCALRPMADVTSKFIYYFLQPLSEYFNLKATGTTFIAIAADIVNGAVFPLPPLAEQKRIVATVDSLMDLCNELKDARNEPVLYSEENKVIHFPKKEEEERILMVAQGAPSQKQSEELRQAIDDLFGDDEDE